MKNLIIAIILIFAGLNEVQSQNLRTNTVREIAGGSETLYHMFSSDQSIFYYNPGYTVSGEYNVSISYTPGLSNTTGIVRVNNNDYVISGEYANSLNVIMSDARTGAGEVYNSNRVEQSGVILDVPSALSQVVLSWGINSLHATGTVFSPNGLLSLTTDGVGVWNLTVRGTGESYLINSQQIAIDWYTCLNAGRTVNILATIPGDDPFVPSVIVTSIGCID